MKYRPVERSQRLYHEIVDQIQDLIVHEELQPGDKLPSERQLVKQFGVSRTVVREAITALEQTGLVEVKHGRGAYIAQPSPDSVSDSLSLLFLVGKSSLLALLEVRQILEVEIAALAAERATEEEKQEMEEALRAEAKVLDSPKEYVEADLRFHQALTKATHNDVLPTLLNPLADSLRKSRLVTSQPEGSTRLSSQGHRAILDAVNDGSKERARQAMREHLQLVRQTILACTEDEQAQTAS